MKKIILTVDADGQSQLVAEDFHGEECRQATAFLREALGQSVSEQLMPEFFRSATHESTHEQNRS